MSGSSNSPIPQKEGEIKPADLSVQEAQLKTEESVKKDATVQDAAGNKTGTLDSSMLMSKPSTSGYRPKEESVKKDASIQDAAGNKTGTLDSSMLMSKPSTSGYRPKESYPCSPSKSPSSPPQVDTISEDDESLEEEDDIFEDIEELYNYSIERHSIVRQRPRLSSIPEENEDTE